MLLLIKLGEKKAEEEGKQTEEEKKRLQGYGLNSFKLEMI